MSELAHSEVSRGSKYIISIDAGTTNVNCTVYDGRGTAIGSGQRPISQRFPVPGWVEQDPVEIWEAVRDSMRDAVEDAGCGARDISAMGIANQRETSIVWDRHTGRPLHDAIGWQCRRTSQICDALREEHGGWIRERTGLKVDAYFSATKLKWLLDNVPDLRKSAECGDALFGTVDSWIIWKLTGGKVHATDVSNASRTMLFDIGKMCWNNEILELLNIPEQMLPDVRQSSGDFGTVSSVGERIPITGVLGDQQAALFGQACFSEGDSKCTYGTGGFLLSNTGDRRVTSGNGLLATVAWGIGGKTTYALEGSIYSTGAAVEWMRDLGLIDTLAQTEDMAKSVPDSGGCYFVPAFSGLGAPYWDQYARGAIVGVTRGTTRAHLVRAALEASAYQVDAVIGAIEDDTGSEIGALKIDGGMSANDFVAQFQADLSDIDVVRPLNIETTSMGAAYMAGLTAGFWKNTTEISGTWKEERSFRPYMDMDERASLRRGWDRAVCCSRTQIRGL